MNDDYDNEIPILMHSEGVITGFSSVFRIFRDAHRFQ